MKTRVRKILAGVVMASSGLVTTGAFAAVAAWDWETDGGFVVGAGSCSNGGEAACNLTYDNAVGATPSGIPGTASVMTWGTPTGASDEKSGLQTITGATGEGPTDTSLLDADPPDIPEFEQIITNGGWTTIGAAVHYNNVIAATGGHMDAAVFRTTFALTAPPALALPAIDIDLTLEETLNESPCTPPNPHGSICDDLYQIDAFPDPIDFIYDGVTYTLSFRYLAGEGAIIDGAGFVYTDEDAPGYAILYNQAMITTAIPAPGVLALMGAGLLALGWRVRRNT